MIKNFKPRLYQETILETASKGNTLVVLPTGMGKTALAVMLAVHRLKLYPNSKILILAPTRPLVEQLVSVFTSMLEIDPNKIAMFTGFVSPQKRRELWQGATIIASTPQGLENDILGRKISLEDVSLLVFDEAHRASGDYSYNFIAKQYNKLSKFPRILALTASPGSDMEKIVEVCENLFIEEIEIRTDDDPDVSPYVQEIDINWVKVTLPEDLLKIKKFLDESYHSKITEIRKFGFIHTQQLNGNSKTELLKLQAQLHAMIASGEKDFEMLKSLSLVAEAVKIQHALELVETQGITPLFSYLDKIMKDSSTSKVKAVQNLGRDPNFRAAWMRTEKALANGTEHPKLARLKEIISEDIRENNDTKIIIFNQYRESAKKIVDELKTIDGCTPFIFVGQQKKGETGMTQKKQMEVLDDFRAGKFNTLVATSVAEEGLDIPAVDHVIFYEPIPSAIRHIQRRGRTGRLDKGKVSVLVATGTRDEGYRWSAHHKEKRMHKTLGELKKTIGTRFNKKVQTTLETVEKKHNFVDEKTIEQNKAIKIFIDAREKGSKVMKELSEVGCLIELARLESADYLISSRCVIEYKTVPDFVDSIIDGRLLDQMRILKKNYERPLVIIEGNEDIYSLRKIHPNAIQGMLATIAVSYNIPILQTKNYKESAGIILTIAKREQQESNKDFSMHPVKKTSSLKEKQEYVVSSLPNIGTRHAKELLEKFGSVKAVINASEEELKEISLIGEKKAKAIKEVTDEKYSS